MLNLPSKLEGMKYNRLHTLNKVLINTKVVLTFSTEANELCNDYQLIFKSRKNQLVIKIFSDKFFITTFIHMISEK